MSPVVSWLMIDKVCSMSKDAFWGASLLTDDELVWGLHEIGAFSLDELAGIVDELDDALLDELEDVALDEYSIALEDGSAFDESRSFDDKFSLK